jgi:hypothetical protein
MQPLCPKCQEKLSTVDVETVDARNTPTSTIPALIYLCPNRKCREVLGVGPNVDAIMKHWVR